MGKELNKIPVLTPKAIAGFISSCAVILGLLVAAVAMVFKPLDQRVTALEQVVAIDKDFGIGAKREYIYDSYNEFKHYNGGPDAYVEQRLIEYNNSLGVNR